MLLIIYRQGLFNSKHIMSDIIYTIMKKIFLFSITLFSVLIFFSCKTENSKSKAKSITSSSEIEISKTELLNKIKGGWAGQVIGCTYGGPTEFKWNGTMIDDHIPIPWDDTRMLWYYENSPGLYDDVYMDLTFVDVFRKYGIDAPDSLHAITFANAEYPLWHANQAARYNILSGIMPPESGYWKNNPHADDIDFQIEADFAGLMSPGMVNSAVEICNRIGRIMNYGDGLYGGMYVAAMYSLAFVHDDIEFIVEEALKVIPEQSDFYQCIYDVIKSYKSNPDDWKFAWFEAQKRWTHDIGCPDGVFMPFNIDAKINAAYIVIGLLYGKGDYGATIDISTRCGYDSDCNPANAAGILGTMIGYDAIPEYWKLGGGNAYKIYDKNDKEIKNVTSDMGFTAGDTINPTQLLDHYHFLNFLDGIRKGTALNADINVGCISSTLALLGNIAQRTKSSFMTNPVNGRILDNKEAQSMWGREYQKGWEMTI
jgi:hypothetical protein